MFYILGEFLILLNYFWKDPIGKVGQRIEKSWLNRARIRTARILWGNVDDHKLIFHGEPWTGRTFLATELDEEGPSSFRKYMITGRPLDTLRSTAPLRPTIVEDPLEDEQGPRNG